MEMCRIIQRTYRRYTQRKQARRMARIRAIQENEDEAALIFQKIFRGYKGRMAANKVREERRKREQIEMRRHALLEISVVKVQQAYRGHKGRADAGIMRIFRQQKKKELKIQNEAAGKIQNLFRCHQGRNARRLLWRAVLETRKRNFAASIIQSLLRRHFLHLQCLRDAELALKRSIEGAANTIQRCWRGTAGRHLGAMMLGHKRLQDQEYYAAATIQRLVRGRHSRVIVKYLREKIRIQRQEVRGTTLVQALYRGHKGREAMEVQKETLKLQVQAKPLWDQLHKFEAELNTITAEVDIAKAAYEARKTEEVILFEFFYLKKKRESFFLTNIALFRRLS